MKTQNYLYIYVSIYFILFQLILKNQVFRKIIIKKILFINIIIPKYIKE